MQEQARINCRELYNKGKDIKKRSMKKIDIEISKNYCFKNNISLYNCFFISYKMSLRSDTDIILKSTFHECKYLFKVNKINIKRITAFNKSPCGENICLNTLLD